MAFFGLACLYAMRVNLSVAIVAMTVSGKNTSSSLKLPLLMLIGKGSVLTLAGKMNKDHNYIYKSIEIIKN